MKTGLTSRAPHLSGRCCDPPRGARRRTSFTAWPGSAHGARHHGSLAVWAVSGSLALGVTSADSALVDTHHFIGIADLLLRLLRHFGRGGAGFGVCVCGECATAAHQPLGTFASFPFCRRHLGA